MMTCLGLQGGANSLSRRPADGSRVRHVLAPLAPVPVWADARPAPERFARLRRLSLNLAFVGPARHRRGRRFPTASGFGRFPPFAGERKMLTNP